MPSIARMLALVCGFWAACPVGLYAQTFPPVTSQPPLAETTSAQPVFVPTSHGNVVSAVFDEPADAGRQSPRPLPSPGRSNRLQPSQTLQSGSSSSSGLPSMVTVVGSLAVVLGIFMLTAWGMRRLAPPGQIVLPGEVFEVLGRAPLAGRQQVHLIRCGKKLLLVSVTTDGAETLTEVTDPLEVDRLLGLCEQAKPGSATATFRQVLGQLSKEDRHG